MAYYASHYCAVLWILFAAELIQLACKLHYSLIGDMIKKIIFGLIAGAIIGGVMGLVLRGAGGACPLACDPSASMITGAFFGVMTAYVSGAQGRSFSRYEHIVEITNRYEFQKTLKKGGLVLVDFYSDGCDPCGKLKPLINELAEEFKGRVKVAGVNVERNKVTAASLGVGSTPDIRLFHDGRQVKRFAGLQSKQAFRDALLERL